ncbi:unnamed protein product [Heterobilharzia americana]|nr:unnamed protein product [Heterobilharzia americana]
MKIISSIYDSFISTKKNSVDANVMHDVIYTFSEVILKLPEEMKKCLVPIFETQIMDDSGTFYDREQFVKYLMIYTRSMSTDVFDQLMEHLKLCAVEFWKAEERHERRKLLKKCFISCDLDQLNEINRDKVFHLCEMYFDTCEQTIKQMIHYPRDWVTREYHLGLSLKESSPRKESMKWQSSAKSENNNQRKTEQILSSEKINDSTVEVFEKLCKQKDKLIKVDQIIETNGLTQHQFISIMEFLIPETVPLNILQQCLMVLRKYTETTEEHDERKLKHFQRNIKLKKDLLMKKIFHTMNRECSGMLNLRKFENYLLDYEDGFYEAHLKQAKSDLFTILQLTASRHLSRQSTLQTDQTTTTTTSTVTCSTIPSFEQISVHSDLDHSNAQLSSLYHYYPEKTVEISLNHFKILLDDIFWPKSDEYLSGHDEFDLSCLEKFLDYLNKKLVENMSNKIRCEIRREWIQKIINAAQNSYSNSMELVYKSIFQILVKDTLKHGGQKQIGVKIAILCPTINENMLSSSIDTQYCLQYVAAIPDSDAESVLGKSPEKQKSDLLTQCLRTGSTLVHCEMSNIKKFSNLNKESQNTSVYNDTEFNVNHQSVPFALAIPIPNTKKYFIGLMEVNNFSDSGQQPKFEEHEIQFYRGVVYQLGYAFSLMSSRHLFTSMMKYALDSIYTQLNSIDQMVFYHLHLSTNDLSIIEDDTTNSSKHNGQIINSLNEEKCLINKDASYPLYRLVSKYADHETTIHKDPKIFTKRIIIYTIIYSMHSSLQTQWNKLNDYQLEYLYQVTKLLHEGYVELIKYTGVSTTGQYTDVSVEDSRISTKQKQSKDTEKLRDVKSDWLDDNNKFTPQRIQRNLTKMELNLLALRIDKNLFNDIKQYNFQLTNSETYIIWCTIILIYPYHEYDPLNEENILKQLDLIKDNIYKSIIEYDPFCHEKYSSSLKVNQLYELLEKISSEELSRYACESMKTLYQWIKLCLTVVN